MHVQLGYLCKSEQVEYTPGFPSMTMNEMCSVLCFRLLIEEHTNSIFVERFVFHRPITFGKCLLLNALL